MYRYRTALAVVGLWLAACSVKQEDFEAQLAEAVCEKYMRCGVSYDKDSCKRGQLQQHIDLYTLTTRYSEALQAGWMQYDAAAATACLEKIRTSSCDQPPLPMRLLMEEMGTSAECRFLFGQVKDGERCDRSGDCGLRSFCTTSSSSSCGTCQPLAGEGMTSSLLTQCEEGLITLKGVCQKPLEEGQTCESAGVFGLGPCAPGLFCDMRNKVCRRAASLGQSCGLSQAPCRWNLVCIEGTCQVPRTQGAFCRTRYSGLHIQSDCKQELFCDADPYTRGTCRELLGEDASCRHDLECDWGLYCHGAYPSSSTRGTCRRFAQEDEDCTSRACENRFYCGLSHICRPIPPLRQSCAGKPGP
ncbi:hypothetical protein ATI61_10964 [Archangium gephyra]|uniref:Dickkopf N-terminal cysteine-rich domain-containing protein n=1 Tax=Archangium gephyra TaxID=48 RepID=A0AAC8Q2D4_9BACT|nr:hypothetical protein [Archangium gephyra]AKI99739.1 Hypothetical protein AA314_01366 [Archangium gephyra]REG27729.1 hypothetical protein ATI61_10964 [Archangium gephyra]